MQSSGTRQCCSRYGYCGVTSEHCGSGCQAGFGACSGSGGPQQWKSPPQRNNQASPPKSVGGCALTADQKLTAIKLTTLFENGVTDPQYGYCEALGDGRGFTAGIIGFCTNNDRNDEEHYCSDALAVVSRYMLSSSCQPPADNPVAKYLDVLGSSKGITDANTRQYPNFCRDWTRTAATSACFRAAQDQQQDIAYYRPSQALADGIGARYALTRAFLYDTIVQHGEDGLRAIMRSAGSLAKGHTLEAEVAWLQKAMQKRFSVLQSGDDVWRASKTRVQAFQKLLSSRQLALSQTVTFSLPDYPNTSIRTATSLPQDAAQC